MNTQVDDFMNQAPAAGGQADKAGDDIGLVDLLIVLAKHKKLLLWLPLAAAVLAAGISLVLPNVYKASVRLMPPQQAQSGAGALLSQLGGIAGAAVGASGGLRNPNDLYVAMLRSRTVAEKLVQRFNLMKVYELESQEKTIALLQKRTAIVSTKDGLIAIDFEDEDQKLVAPLANAYVAELTQLTRNLAVTEAGQRRMFYERQLEQAKDNLARAEAALKTALDTRGVISVDVESRALLETVGRLRAQISAKEIQLNSMSASLTPNNPEYRQVQQELSSLRAEVAKLENGRGGAAEPGAGKQGGFENIKLLRDVKYFQLLYELLAKQYEIARLDEAKDPAVIQVLDPAREPERKSKPERTVIVILTAMAALLLAIVLAFLIEARRSLLANEKGAARWRELRAHLGLKTPAL